MPNTQAMSDTLGTRNRVAMTDKRRMSDCSDHVSTGRAWLNEAISYDCAYFQSSVGFLTYHILDPTCERGWEILFCRKTSLHPTLCPFRLSIIINVEPLNLEGLTLCDLCKVIYQNQRRTSESGWFDRL